MKPLHVILLLVFVLDSILINAFIHESDLVEHVPSSYLAHSYVMTSLKDFHCSRPLQ